MFVKIKMEPKCSRLVDNLKDTQYISVEDNATITMLKSHIEQHVNIPAERQEIRTLTATYANTRTIKEICDDRASSIMLYAYDDDFCDSQEPRFVCFIQIYTNESRLKIQEMELQQSSVMANAPEWTASRPLSSGTLIAVSETGSSDSESVSDEFVSNLEESDSSESSDNSTSRSAQKKRKLSVKQNVDQKRQKTNPVLNTLSPTLNDYLNEFPKSDVNSDKHNESNSEDGSSEESDSSKVSSKNCDKSNNIKEMLTATTGGNDASIRNKEIVKSPAIIETHQNVAESKVYEAKKSPTDYSSAKMSTEVQKTPTQQRKPDIHSTITSTTHDFQHPCYAINPEKRQYMLCISAKAGDIQRNEFESLLEWFVERFHSAEDIPQNLHFIHQSPITHFDGKVWIGSMNKATCDWVSSSLSHFSQQSYKIESLLKDDRHQCEVVIPKVVTKVRADLLDIFKLLEKQNPNLCTLRWCVNSRRILDANEEDYETRSVSAFCTNELLSLWIDDESKKLLEEVQMKLKYCFWEILFKFVNN